MLRTDIVRRADDLAAIAPRWRDLLAAASHRQPVSTPLWLLAWWKEFGDADGRALRAVLVFDADELVGLLPLASRRLLHRRAIPVRRLELLGTGEDESDEICSEYVGALVARGREADVARAAVRALLDGALGDWDELRMTAMNGDDPFVERLAGELRGAGVDAAVDRTGECPYVPLPATWDEYLRALGSSRRYVVTRSLRELDKWAAPGGWQLRRATTPDELLEGRRVLRELHAERWEASGRSGVFASERFARFHDVVMPRLLAGEDGARLDLSWLVARGEPIAASYSVVFDDKVYFYQSG